MHTHKEKQPMKTREIRRPVDAVVVSALFLLSMVASAGAAGPTGTPGKLAADILPQKDRIAWFDFSAGNEDKVRSGRAFECRNVALEDGAMRFNGVYVHSLEGRTNGCNAELRVPELDRDAFSVCLSFRPEMSPGRELPLLNFGGAHRWFYAQLERDGRLCFGLNCHDIRLRTEGFAAVGEWNWFVCSVDVAGKTLRCVLNGVRLADVPIPADFAYKTGSDRFAAFKTVDTTYWNSGIAFKGDIAGFVLFGHPLRDGEIDGLRDALAAKAKAEKDGLPLPADIRGALAFRAGGPGLDHVAKFAETMMDSLDAKRAEADRKKQTIRKQLVSALEREKDAAQKKGDLDAVLVFMEAIKDPDAVAKPVNPVLVPLLSKRNAAVAKVEEWLKTEQVPILLAGIQRLDAMKREETKKGNIANAKAINDYQSTVQALLAKSSPKHAAKPPAKPRTGETTPPAGAALETEGDAVVHTVSVDKESGRGLGNVEAGEILVVQYVSGRYRHRYSSYSPASPDADPRSDDSAYYAPAQRPFIKGPSGKKEMRTWDIPRGTAAKPFAVLVEEPGYYTISAYAGSYWEGKLTYKVSKLSAASAKHLLESSEKNKYQWPRSVARP